MPKLMLKTLFGCAALLLLSQLHAWGLDPNRPIKQFHHTAWNESDGLSGFVYALAQTNDGFLWIGSSSGLYLFDGLRFELYQRPELPQQITDIRALLATRDGGLWVGYRTGVAFLRDGKTKTFTETDGLPYGRVRGLAQTRDGAVWASVVGGFARYFNGHWERVRSQWNYPDNDGATSGRG